MLIVTCPSCDQVIQASDSRFVAESPDLMGDPVLGPDHPLRFRPMTFDADGIPLDPSGALAPTPACPLCRAKWPSDHWRREGHHDA